MKITNSNADKVLKVRHFKPYMLTAHDEYGLECYFVICCPAHKAQEIQEGKFIDLADICMILYQSYKKPNDSEFEILKERFGISKDM